MSSAMQVNPSQEGNKLLSHIRHMRYVYNDKITCDYLCGNSATIAATFISVRYHLLKPKYLEMRMREIAEGCKVRIVLAHVDVEECLDSIHELNKLCFTYEFTLVLAWSEEETARYLESFHVYEGRSSSAIQEKVENEFMPIAVKALTSIKSVNRTDVSTLLNKFGSFADVCGAKEQQLVQCPGMGDTKVKRVLDALHASFK